MSQVYSTYEKPLSAVAASALNAGVMVIASAADSVGGFTVGFPAAGAKVDGVSLIDDIAIGDTTDFTTEVGRIVPVKASAAIAFGAEIATTAAGLAVTAASGNYIVGKALGAATVANQVIPMLFQPNGVKA